MSTLPDLPGLVPELCFDGPDSVVPETESYLGTSSGRSAIAIPFAWQLDQPNGANYLLLFTDLPPISVTKGVAAFGVRVVAQTGRRRTQRDGRFWVFPDPDGSGIYYLLTLESADYFKRIVLPLLRAAYPRIVLAVIPQQQLRRLLDDFGAQCSPFRLTVTRAAIRARQGKLTIKMQTWPPHQDLQDAYDLANANNGWFNSLSFDLRRPNSTVPLAQVRVTRQGLVRTSALFKRVFDGFCRPAAGLLRKELSFLGDRSRTSSPDLSARPLAVRFKECPFESESGKKDFIAAVKGLRTASVSVMHGNPYVHLSIIDYYDGSVFDVWVVNERETLVVPQLRATAAGLDRLLSHIYDTFAEGEATDPTEAIDG